MKKTLFFILLVFTAWPSLAQKPAIDTTTFKNWPQLAYKYAISANGKYVSYSVTAAEDTLFLQDLAGNKKWAFNRQGNTLYDFTADSKAFCFLTDRQIHLVELPAGKVVKVANAAAYTLFRREGHELILFLDDKGLLQERDLKNGKVYSYGESARFLMNERQDKIATYDGKELRMIDLQTRKSQLCHSSPDISQIVFSQKGYRLAFLDGNAVANKRVLVFDWNSARLNKVFEPGKTSIPDGLRLERIDRFAAADDIVLIKLMKIPVVLQKKNPVKVDVWSYLDEQLYPNQEVGDKRPMFSSDSRIFAVSVSSTGGSLIRLQNEREEMGNTPISEFIIVNESPDGVEFDSKWKRSAQFNSWLVDVRSGKRTPLPRTRYVMEVSPSKRFIMGQGALPGTNRVAQFAYELKTGKGICLDDLLNIPELSVNNDLMSPPGKHLFVAGWMKDADKVLLYDDYDIWEIDLNNAKTARNLTGGYGRRNGIALRFSVPQAEKIFESGKRYIITGFNKTTKHSGFLSLTLSAGAKLIPHYMGPYTFDVRMGQARETGNITPAIKAQAANVWLVKRMTTNESENLFYTTDFNIYHPISNIHPERKYNWMTAEVKEFHTTDGRKELGVLYKPENFDPAKKYPVIIHYYQELSDRAFQFKYPEPVMHNIEIPWFVSHGYLVFTPDIHYKRGHTATSAYQSVVGAANYLKTFPWVDAAHMGIQGQSFGGYETNHIVTQTDMFAAAMASAGPSNALSALSAYFGKEVGSKHDFYQYSQYRMGVTFWEDPQLYFEASPVLNAHRVTTPLLLMNNIMDTAVPFTQGLEMFCALRRMGKRVWMLQYDNGAHTINEHDGVQHTIRMTQFFDHYLKGAPAPRWMTRGIPAAMKGYDDGLALDTEIKTPGPGLLSKEEQEKMDRLKVRKVTTVTF